MEFFSRQVFLRIFFCVFSKCTYFSKYFYFRKINNFFSSFLIIEKRKYKRKKKGFFFFFVCRKNMFPNFLLFISFFHVFLFFTYVKNLKIEGIIGGMIKKECEKNLTCEKERKGQKAKNRKRKNRNSFLFHSSFPFISIFSPILLPIFPLSVFFCLLYCNIKRFFYKIFCFFHFAEILFNFYSH